MVLRFLDILFAQYGTISDIEILWIGLATVGGIFSLINLINAFKDRQAAKLVHLQPNDPRAHVAAIALRMEAARLTMQLIFLTIGILAASIADPPQELLNVHQQITRFIFTWGLITSAGLVTLKSYWGFQVRRDIILLDLQTRIVDDAVDKAARSAANEVIDEHSAAGNSKPDSTHLRTPFEP